MFSLLLFKTSLQHILLILPHTSFMMSQLMNRLILYMITNQLMVSKD